MKKSNYRFIFNNDMRSSWYSFDDIINSWNKLPPSIIKGDFKAVIIEEEMTIETI